MARGKVYDYERIDRRKEAQDDWYLQRRREMQEEEENELAEHREKSIQTKLEISQSGDKHEQEADLIAKNVVNGGNADVQQVTSVTDTAQTKPEAGAMHASDELQSSINNSKGSGQSLDDSTKTEMESKMGADFSDVKIHTGSEAHEMSESINAKAFTHGQDIYFKDGNYDTNSSAGKELLAHELTHTVQQGNGVQRKIQRQGGGYVPNQWNTSLTGDDRGAMGYLPSESDFAGKHQNDSVETKIKIINEFLNYKNSSDPNAKSLWQKFTALNDKKGPNSATLVQSLWEQAVKIKTKSDQAVKDIDAAGDTKRAALEGLYVRKITSRSKPYEKKSADWGHWKEYEPGKYNKNPYDHNANPNLKYTKNKFHGFGSMMILDEHMSGGYNATTNALLLLEEKLTDEKKFATHVQSLLAYDPGAKYFAAVMSALRDISSLVDKITAAKTAAEKTGLSLHHMLALYGQEGNFTMPASHASLQAGIPVTERGGLSMVGGGILDFSTNNVVLPTPGWDLRESKLVALGVYRVQIAGLDVVSHAVTKATEGVTDMDEKVKKSLGAMAKWSFDNRQDLKNDNTVDKNETGRTLSELEALWKEQYDGIQVTNKTHRKETATEHFDNATIYAPLDPEKLTAFILTEAGLYFKRSINSGKTTGGVGMPFTPEVAYLMYNVTGIPNKSKTISFITQAVKAAFKLTKGKPADTPAGKLGIPPKLLAEVKALNFNSPEDITTTFVEGWLTPERWKLIMEYLPLAGQDELRLKQGADDKFQNQINMSNFSTLAKFYKDVFPVQKKSLGISQSNDPHEKEADEVARKVVSGESAEVSGKTGNVLRKNENVGESNSQFETQLSTSKGGGDSLPENIRQDIGGKMGADLSDVKIHTGSEAHDMSESINAKAFTHGQDIYFKSGNYDTNSRQGKELLAHELTHTVQQSPKENASIMRSPDGDAAKEKFKSLLDKTKARNAVNAHKYLKSLDESVRNEIYADPKMTTWIARMNDNLPVQYLENRDFGYQAGLGSAELAPATTDNILIEQLSDDETWKDPVQLDLLLKMIVQAGLQNDALLRMKDRWLTVTPDINSILQQNGFTPSGYVAPVEEEYTEGSNWRSIKNFLWRSGKHSLKKGVAFNKLHLNSKATLIGFSLPVFQQSRGGHIGGAHFSEQQASQDRGDLKKQGFSKSSFDIDKMVTTPGTISLQFDGNNGHFFINAYDLPMDSINTQLQGSTVRVGKSDIKELKAKYYWQGTKNSEGNGGNLSIKELSLSNIRNIGKDSTMGIGLLSLHDLTISINKPLGTAKDLPGFYEATLACINQVLDILFAVLDSGMVVSDHFFKGVGAGAAVEMSSIVGKYGADMSMVISFSSMKMDSLIHSKYMAVKSISMGKTEIAIGSEGYIRQYNHAIDNIRKQALDEKREVNASEQQEIQRLQTLIDNEARITLLTNQLNQPGAEKNPKYQTDKAELDGLIAGRQAAFNLSTSSLEINRMNSMSGQTKFGTNLIKLESLNASAQMDKNGPSQISADWGKASLGVDDKKKTGLSYKDETKNYSVGVTMDSAKYGWKKGEKDVLKMTRPVFYTDPLKSSTSADMGEQRSDVTTNTVQVPDMNMPFLKADQVILTWPVGGDLIPNVEVLNPEITGLEVIGDHDVTIPAEQYVNEVHYDSDPDKKKSILATVKQTLGDNVVLWRAEKKTSLSGKIDGQMSLVRDAEKKKWMLSLKPADKANGKDELVHMRNVMISSLTGEGKQTREGSLVESSHFFSHDIKKYPEAPKKAEAPRKKLEFDFLDGMEESIANISVFGKNVPMKIEKGGFIAPAETINKLYKVFLDEFNQTQLKKNLQAGAMRLADHLSGKSGTTLTSMALGWSWQEAYKNLSYPLNMIEHLHFSNSISGGYYGLATYNGATLMSTYKLAPATKDALSADKKKIKLSSLIEYQLRTEKENKKPVKEEMLDQVIKGISEAFSETWNRQTFGQWLKTGKDMEATPTSEVIKKIDAWWEQAMPGLVFFAGVGGYLKTVALQQGVPFGIISGLMSIVAKSDFGISVTGGYNYGEGSAKGTVGLSMDKNLNPQFTVPDLTIGKVDRNYGNYHVSLTDLHMQNGLINTNWSLTDFKMNFPDSTINTFTVDWPVEKE